MRTSFSLVLLSLLAVACPSPTATQTEVVIVQDTDVVAPHPTVEATTEPVEVAAPAVVD